MSSQIYKLRVRLISDLCDFELVWGKGQSLSTQIPYPEILTLTYQRWQDCYFKFYRQCRGRVYKRGVVSKPSEDWRALLVQAEAELLDRFHYWLLSPELVPIRRQLATSALKSADPLLVCLACTPLDLARLPWETWEIGTDLGASHPIYWVRTFGNIACEPVYPVRRKARVLAILGDDTGLEFQGDRDAVTSLSRLATVEFVGWTGKGDPGQLKHDISGAIADPQGWDILFFAGHSNETSLTGGELAIAPGISLSIHDLSESLHLAKTRGLQFAIFNSCSGLAIAQSLINLGLNQVAVMREPIHNRVAQEFLLQFIKSLTQFRPVHQALLEASDTLKQQEKRLTYPSAYLIPSLFTHPEAAFFQIQPFGWQQRLKQWLPRKTEAIGLALLTTLSCVFPLQVKLLNHRIGIQAQYRHLTRQLPTAPTPPTILIQIDNQSIAKAGISSPVPMDRAYLSQLIERLSQLNTKVIGLDYLLDRPHRQIGDGNNDITLAKTLQNAVKNNQTWFVFVSKQDSRQGWISVLPEIASPHWSLQGRMTIFKQGYMQLVPPPVSFSSLLASSVTSTPLPFSYLLALSYYGATHGDTPAEYPSSPQPYLDSSQDLEEQLLMYLSEQSHPLLSVAQTSKISFFSYALKQMWLHPIIDYSLPPSQVYYCLPAWQLLQITDQDLESRNWLQTRPLGSAAEYCHPPTQPESFAKSVVIIAPGGYDEAGITPGGDNIQPPPAGFHYWTGQKILTGGEVHGYMVYHILNQRLMIPIPDLWVTLVAALLTKGVVLGLSDRRFATGATAILLTILTLLYGLIVLQVYVSFAILVPWCFPVLVMWWLAIAQRLGRSMWRTYTRQVFPTGT